LAWKWLALGVRVESDIVIITVISTLLLVLLGTFALFDLG